MVRGLECCCQNADRHLCTEWGTHGMNGLEPSAEGELIDDRAYCWRP